MKDSVASRFNDPSSYEFVSMTIDTFRLKDYLSDIRISHKINLNFGKDEQNSQPAEVEELEKRNGDSIIHYQITVKCRAKNAMGALILNDVNLILDPNNNKITQSPQANQ